MWLQKVTGFLTKLNRPLVGFIKNVALWMLAMMMFLTFTSLARAKAYFDGDLH